MQSSSKLRNECVSVSMKKVVPRRQPVHNSSTFQSSNSSSSPFPNLTTTTTTT